MLFSLVWILTFYYIYLGNTTVLGSSTHFCKFLSSLLTKNFPTRSYFFYYRISQNGKKHPFTVELFAIWILTLRQMARWRFKWPKSFQHHLAKQFHIFKWIFFTISTSAIIEEIASAVFKKCYWHFRWKDRKLNPANVVDHKLSGLYWVLECQCRVRHRINGKTY